MTQQDIQPAFILATGAQIGGLPTLDDLQRQALKQARQPSLVQLGKVPPITADLAYPIFEGAIEETATA